MVPVVILRCDRARLAHSAKNATEARRIADRINADPRTIGLPLVAFADLHQKCTIRDGIRIDSDSGYEQDVP